MRFRVRDTKPALKSTLRFMCLNAIVGACIYSGLNISSAVAQPGYSPEFRGIIYGDPTDAVRQKKGEPISRDLNETKRQEIWQYPDLKVTFIQGRTRGLEIIKRGAFVDNQISEGKSPGSGRRHLKSAGDQRGKTKETLEKKSVVPFKFEKGEVLQLLKEISLTESSDTGSSPSQPQGVPPMAPGFRSPEMGRAP